MEYLIDAENKRLGRLASEIAIILQGKKNPQYEPRLAGSDRVRIKNIKKITVSGKKERHKAPRRRRSVHRRDEVRLQSVGLRFHLRPRPQRPARAAGHGHIIRQSP